MNLRLPPHIGWPMLVIGLLLMSLSAAAITVVASQSGRGTQVVEDYYGQAARWDETAALRAAVEAEGLHVTVEVEPGSHQAPLRPVVISVRDRAGQPVTGLQGTLRAFRPQRAGAVATIPLTPAPEAPGTYRQLVPLGAAGLWDFEIHARHNSLAFQTTLRKDLR